MTIDNDNTTTVQISPTQKDFNLGYEMGCDALQLISKHVQARAADHEPIVMLGMMSVIIECAYRSCVDKEDVEELIGIARDMAIDAAEARGEGTMH